MVWMLICIGILTLLIVYGFFPSTELYLVLLLLSLLLAVYTLEVARTFCCGTTEIQNLQPDLSPRVLKSSPSKAASKACWGRSGHSGTKRLKKESPKEKTSPGCGSVSSGSTAAAEHRECVPQDTLEESSVLPFEYPADEAAAEIHPNVVLREEPICVIIEDNHNGYSRVVMAGIVDETSETDAVDDSNLSGIAARIEVVMEGKQASKILKDLGPTLDYRREVRHRVMPGCVSTYD